MTNFQIIQYVASQNNFIDEEQFLKIDESQK